VALCREVGSESTEDAPGVPNAVNEDNVHIGYRVGEAGVSCRIVRAGQLKTDNR
jgi:hypothetical protein